MKKRVLSFGLMLLFLFSLGLNVSATQTLSEFLASKHIPASLNVTVPANAQLKLDSDASYVEGPIVLTYASESEFPAFSFRTTLDMAPVRTAFARYMSLARTQINGDTALLNELDNSQVTGTFQIDITYPANFLLPASLTGGSQMDGFNDDAKSIFKETSRVITPGTAMNTATMTIEVKSADGTRNYVTAQELEQYLNSYLGDITFTCTGTQPTLFGTHTVTVAMTGSTVIRGLQGESDVITTIQYNAVQSGTANGPIQASLKLSEEAGQEVTPPGGESSDGPGSLVTPSGPSQPTQPTEPGLNFDINGDLDFIPGVDSDDDEPFDVNLDELEVPEKEGFVFGGWFEDPGLTKEVTGTITIDKETTLYGSYINVTVPDAFVDDDHFAYIVGYPDGTVRPNDNISREEVAAIFFRLLKDEVRTSMWATENDFADVEAARWSNTEISTIANGGYIVGYEGNFRPEDAITRAELATIAAKFWDGEEGETHRFTDITGHWAESYIKKIANAYWIVGDGDGCFRPDDAITRAEAMTLFNKILVRYADKNSTLEEIKQWPDSVATDWFYYQVLEATNSHDFIRQDNQYDEVWTAIKENKVWE